jgi:hypothetical protein
MAGKPLEMATDMASKSMDAIGGLANAGFDAMLHNAT